MATLILRWLEAQGAQVTGEHLCKPDWTGCKGRCGECRGEKIGERLRIAIQDGVRVISKIWSRMCAKALEHYPHLKDALPPSDDDDEQWPEHIIDATQDEPGDTASEDRYDSEEDMEVPAFSPSKKRRTRRERSQAASRSLGPRERGGGAPSQRGPPPLPPPSQPPSDSGSHATAAGSVAVASLQGRVPAQWPGSGCPTRPGRQAKSCNRAPPLPGKMFLHEVVRPAATRLAQRQHCGAPVILQGRPRSPGLAAKSGAAPPGGPSSTCRPASHRHGLASKTIVTPHGALTRMHPILPGMRDLKGEAGTVQDRAPAHWS